MINTTIILFCSLIIVTVFLMMTFVLFLKSRVIYEKIQTINIFNTIVVIYIAIYCYYINKPQYIDIAITYALLSFIGMLGLKKYFELNNKENSSNTNSGNDS